MKSDLQALVVDYGGVLTGDLGAAMGAWLERDDIDPAAFRALMREWLTPGAAANPVHELELGTLPGPDFEHRLAARLTTRDGRPIDPQGLLGRMFAAFGDEPDMYAVLLEARARGAKTALLSNSWGNTYPREQFAALFDVVVISGERGMRKPDPEIYLLTAEELGVEPAACVFVDDLPPNVQAAVDVGMVGIRHSDAATTVTEIRTLFGWDEGSPPTSG